MHAHIAKTLAQLRIYVMEYSFSELAIFKWLHEVKKGRAYICNDVAI